MAAGVLALVPLSFALLALHPCAKIDPPILPSATEPQPWQSFQRDAAGLADIPVRTPAGGDGAAVARWGNAAWQHIDADASDGVQGILRGVPVGWHVVDVRLDGAATPLLHVAPVAVGDVFVIDGQSNAMMQGETRHRTFYGAGVLPRVVAEGAPSFFRPAHDSFWKTAGGFGSAWPLVADWITAETGVPVGFVAVAEGATGLVNPPHWSPGRRFWNRMITNTMTATGGTGRVAAVLKDQGESDANHHVDYAAFQDALCAYPAALAEALGHPTPLVVAQTGRFPIVPEAQLQPIRDAQRDAARDCPDVYGGFETVDLPKNATGHYADAAIPELARRWCLAIASLPLYASGPAPRCD